MDYIFYKVMVGGLVHVQYILSIFHFSTVLEYFGTLVWLSCRNHWQVTHLLISVASVCSSVRFKLDFLFRSLIYWPAQWYLMAKFYFSVKNRINIFHNILVFFVLFHHQRKTLSLSWVLVDDHISSVGSRSLQLLIKER